MLLGFGCLVFGPYLVVCLLPTVYRLLILVYNDLMSLCSFWSCDDNQV